MRLNGSALNASALNASGGVLTALLAVCIGVGGATLAGDAVTYKAVPVTYTGSGGAVFDGAAEYGKYQTVGNYPGVGGIESAGLAGIGITKCYTSTFPPSALNDRFAGGTATASSTYGSQLPSLLLDGIGGTYWMSTFNDGANPWVKVYVPSLPTLVKFVAHSAGYYTPPTSYTLEGSNNNLYWEPLGTCYTPTDISFDLQAAQYYYYRLTLHGSLNYKDLDTLNGFSYTYCKFQGAAVCAKPLISIDYLPTGLATGVFSGLALTYKPKQVGAFVGVGGAIFAGVGATFVPLPLVAFIPTGGITTAGSYGPDPTTNVFDNRINVLLNAILVGDPIITGSLGPTVSTDPILALDCNLGTYFRNHGIRGQDFWIKAEFQTARVLDTVYLGASGSPNLIKGFRVEGSVNGSNWDTLYEGTTQNISTLQTFFFGNTTAYVIYRVSRVGVSWLNDTYIYDLGEWGFAYTGSPASYAGVGETKYLDPYTRGKYTSITVNTKFSGAAATWHVFSYQSSGGLLSSGAAITGAKIRSYVGSGGGVYTGNSVHFKTNDLLVMDSVLSISFGDFTYYYYGASSLGTFTSYRLDGLVSGGACVANFYKSQEGAGVAVFGGAGVTTFVQHPIKFCEGAGGLRSGGVGAYSIKNVQHLFEPQGGLVSGGMAQAAGHGGLNLSGVHGGPGYGGGGVLRDGGP